MHGALCMVHAVVAAPAAAAAEVGLHVGWVWTMESAAVGVAEECIRTAAPAQGVGCGVDVEGRHRDFSVEVCGHGGMIGVGRGESARNAVPSCGVLCVMPPTRSSQTSGAAKRPDNTRVWGSRRWGCQVRGAGALLWH